MSAIVYSGYNRDRKRIEVQIDPEELLLTIPADELAIAAARLLYHGDPRLIGNLRKRLAEDQEQNCPQGYAYGPLALGLLALREALNEALKSEVLDG